MLMTHTGPMAVIGNVKWWYNDKISFQEEDLGIELEDETRYFADLEKDVCLDPSRAISKTTFHTFFKNSCYIHFQRRR